LGGVMLSDGKVVPHRSQWNWAEPTLIVSFTAGPRRG
jgi:hypothetical protein